MELIDKKLWARAIIRDTIRNDIEFQSVVEMMDPVGDEDDARHVHDLIRESRIEVSWDG